MSTETSPNIIDDKYRTAGLVMVLHYLGIITMYSEDVEIIVGIHRLGPGFADED